jgi:hypothetical protein
VFRNRLLKRQKIRDEWKVRVQRLYTSAGVTKVIDLRQNEMYGTLTCKTEKLMHVETVADRAYGIGKNSE